MVLQGKLWLESPRCDRSRYIKRCSHCSCLYPQLWQVGCYFVIKIKVLFSTEIVFISTSSISLVDALAVKELIPNLGINTNRMNVGSIQMRGLSPVEDNGNPNREVERRDAAENEEVVEIDCERVSQSQEVLTRGFRVIEVYGNIRTKVVQELENGEERFEDTSDAKYHELHRSKEKAEKKLVEKQKQSDRWELRNEREKGKRKTNQTNEVEVRKKVRLGPEPCDATHISVEDNLLPSVLGREVAFIVAEPFELPGSQKIKTRKSDFKKKGKRGELVQEESLTGNHLVHDNNLNRGRVRKEDNLRAVRTETSNWSDAKSDKKNENN